MSFSSYEQEFIVDNQIISGISSVTVSYGSDVTPLYLAGMGYIDSFISGPVEGEFNITRYMIGEDLLADISDTRDVSGGFALGEGVLQSGFTKGRVISRKVACNIGEVPTIENTIKIYGNFGGGIPAITDVDITAGDFVPGLTYKITSVGNTTFPGAADNNVGTVFTATAAGSGTGTATIVYSEPEPTMEESLAAYDKVKVAAVDREYTIPTQGSIRITIGTSNYSILGFNYDRTLNVEALYALNKEHIDSLKWYEAHDTQITYPIETKFDFTIAQEDYNILQMRELMDYDSINTSVADLDIKMYDPQSMEGSAPEFDSYEPGTSYSDGDQVKGSGKNWEKIGGTTGTAPAPSAGAHWKEVWIVINSYSATRAKMSSVSQASATGDDTTVSLTFIGYETDPKTPDQHEGTSYLYPDDVTAGTFDNEAAQANSDESVLGGLASE
jgi:hypothetical protein